MIALLSLLLLVLFISFLLFSFIYLEWNKFIYRKFSSEPTFPILGHILDLPLNSEVFLKKLINNCKKFKRFFSLYLGPFQVYVILHDPDDIEVILKDQQNLKKGDLYLIVNQWLGKGLLTSTGEHWHRHRKLITPAFHFGILERFVEVFESNAEILVNKLKKHDGDESFDIYPYMSLCTLDNMIDSTMGISLGVQTNEECEYLQTIYKALNIMMLRSLQPWYYNDYIFALSKSGRLQAKYLDKLKKFTYKIIEQKKREKKESNNDYDNMTEQETDGIKKKRLAFLDLLLEIQKKDPTFTDKDVREETDTFVFEGHDTTASGISFCLYNISRHPDVQDKIYSEIENIFGNSSRKATYNDLQKMTYLEKVIKESLRIHPSVPMINRKTETDIRLKDNTLIPKGTEVGIFFKGLGMNEKFWPEPEKFNPDRFNIDENKPRHTFAFAAFSAGPRNCIGQKFAMLQLKTLVSRILRNFKLKDANHELRLCNDITLKSVNGICIALQERMMN